MKKQNVLKTLLLAALISGFSTAVIAQCDSDTEPPVARCKDITVYLIGNGGAVDLDGNSINNGSTDNCGIQYLSVSKPWIFCDQEGVHQVTLTVRDSSGNQSNCTSNVNAVRQDFAPPIAHCKDACIYLDATGNTTLSVSTVDDGSWEYCNSNVTVSVSPNTFTSNNIGANTVTLTADDNRGNTATCTSTVTVLDNTLLVARCKDATVYLDANGRAIVNPADIDNGSGDNCGFTMSVSPTTFDCSQQGANTVTLTVTNGSNNSSTCTATVTVADNTLPVARCKNATVYLDANGNASVTLADVDNGSSDNCSFTMSVSPNTFDCSNRGANTVTLTATDGSNNSSTCTATVTITDNTPPVARCKDATVHLDANGAAFLSASDIDNGSSDNCGIGFMFIDGSTFFSCNQKGIRTATLAVSDISGAMSQCTATVRVLDPIYPVARCKDATVYLDANGEAFLGASDIDNGSSDNCQYTMYVSFAQSRVTCSDIGTILVGLTVSDDGNVSDCFANVTVIDTIPLVARCKDATVYLDANGNATVAPADIDNGSSDNCNFTMSVSPNTFGCSNIGANTVTLITTDGSNNSSTCTATVTIADNTPPYLTCTDYEANITGTSVYIPEVYMTDGPFGDNCGISHFTSSKSTFTCEDVGQQIVVTVTLHDRNGNSSSCISNVSVIDRTPPAAHCKDATVYLDANGNATVTPADIDNGSSDNCNLTMTVTPSTTFTCSNTGANTVTLIARDASYNHANCNAQVTVLDTIPPTVVCKDFSVVLSSGGLVSANQEGHAAITPDDVLESATDNCEISSSYLSQSNFTCLDIGVNEVTAFVVDASGNIASCSGQVTVQGQLSVCSITAVPANNTFTGGLTTNIYLGYGSQSVTLQSAVTSGTPASYSWTGAGAANLSCTNCAAPVFAPVTQGLYTFMLSVVNTSGCSSECSITICVIDVRTENNKVFLSHYPDGELPCGSSLSCNSIAVSASAIAAHLNHPCDHLGSCSGTGNQVCAGGTSAKTDETDGIAATPDSRNTLLEVTAFPNPFSRMLTLNITGQTNEPMTVEVLDVVGKLISTQKGIPALSVIEVGSQLADGVYLVRVTQGETEKVVRIVKSE